MDSSYPYGDVLPNGTPKTLDSANFGLFKNNWLQIRTHCAQFKGQQQADWNNGAVLNTNDAAAIKCQHEQIAAVGQTQFYVNQRGAGGAQGGADYGNAVKFIRDFLDGSSGQGKHLTDNVVTYYNLHPV